MGYEPWYITAIQVLLPYIIMIVAAIIVVILAFRLLKKRGFVPKLLTFLIVTLVFFCCFFMFIDKPMQSVYISFNDNVPANEAELFIEDLDVKYSVVDYWPYSDMPSPYVYYPENSYTLLFKDKKSRFEISRIARKIKQNSIVEKCEANDEFFGDGNGSGYAAF